ncbi:hypothetical protein WR25_03268 [Diploscapter pachys]|uniref:Uncharacterized protein n=1 Tax=Diploscapter pachys TaxID=2018661 RepID=A0A2A2JQ95_9BILA|nr:hypothetical protein WR25_03268 [Diploscapter pachys]
MHSSRCVRLGSDLTDSAKTVITHRARLGSRGPVAENTNKHGAPQDGKKSVEKIRTLSASAVGSRPNSDTIAPSESQQQPQQIVNVGSTSETNPGHNKNDGISSVAHSIFSPTGNVSHGIPPSIAATSLPTASVPSVGGGPIGSSLPLAPTPTNFSGPPLTPSTAPPTPGLVDFSRLGPPFAAPPPPASLLNPALMAAQLGMFNNPQLISMMQVRKFRQPGYFVTSSPTK